MAEYYTKILKLEEYPDKPSDMPQHFDLPIGAIGRLADGISLKML